MPEWISSQEWWRWTWGPLLTAGMVWFASVWSKKTDARGTLDARLDGRLDKMLASQQGEIKRLADEVDRQMRLCEEMRQRVLRAEKTTDEWRRYGHFLHERARRLRHDLNNCRQIFVVEAKTRGLIWAEELPLPDPPAD